MDSEAAGSSTMSLGVSNFGDRGPDLKFNERSGSINAGIDSGAAGSSTMSTEVSNLPDQGDQGTDLEITERPGSMINADMDSEAVGSSSMSMEDSNLTDRGPDVEFTERPGSINDIGPFSASAGIKRNHFEKETDELPKVREFTNGLVLELYSYLCKEIQFSDRAFARKLIEWAGVSVNESNLVKYVSRLREKHTKIKRNKKGEAREEQLASLLHDKFLFYREIHRRTSVPDTPVKRKLREQLGNSKAEAKGMKRKLVECQAREEELRDTLEQERVMSEEEMGRLRLEVNGLQKMNEEAREEVQILTASFDPYLHELSNYKKMYNQKLKDLTSLEERLAKCQEKFKKVDKRNMNKKIKRRDDHVSKLQSKNNDLHKAINELKEELQLSQEQAVAAKETSAKLADKTESKAMANRQNYKRFWYQNKARTKEKQLSAKESDDGRCALEERISFLERRNKDLEELIALLDHEDVNTFHDGRYNDTIRKTIMELLAQNVSMNMVNSVIRTVLKNLAGKVVARLPSAGTRSRIALEANHLATIEVAMAMKSAKPEDAIGNCVHGDGTTKYHKKYQNWQVTLPDGTSRSFGMMEMGGGDTDAVMDSFTDRVKELSIAIEGVTGNKNDEVFKELVATVKSTMTDQGPTMPQFNAKLQSVRTNLLPEVVENWEILPNNVKESMAEFGAFYCKMHPLVNFAEEVNKVLKNFEDFTTSGKHAHVLQTAEAGVTRLVRTASKAFHYRGCDKSGVEDVFSSFLENACGVTNKMVNYIGNRANILFEGAFYLFYHVEHMKEFLSLLDHKNNLLLAVEEDVNEKLYIAELKALGLFYRVAIKPLWDIVRGKDCIFDVNEPLHQLQCKLLVWKEDATPVLQGDSPYNVDLTDEVAQKLLQQSDADSEAMTIQALELISCAVLLILQRQCKDQLPGGKYWQPSDSTLASFKNVPTTNLIGERDFAQLDMLIRSKPSARITTLESIIMWTNNKTPEWLDSLSDDDRASYMKMARQGSGKVLQKYRERKEKIKKQKWDSLQKNQQKKKDTDQKKMLATTSLVEEVVKLGGLWTSEDKIKREVEKLRSSKTEEGVRRAIFTQLSFLHKVVDCKGPSKEHFQLTQQQNSFSSHEMEKHLVEVVDYNHLCTEIDPVEAANTAQQKHQGVSGLDYTPTEEQAENFEDQKKKLGEKIESEKKKRAAQASKLVLANFLEKPELLVGKEIEHLFIIAHEKMWVRGQVIGIKTRKEDSMKTVYEIDYEDEDEIQHYNLLRDLKKNELIVK